MTSRFHLSLIARVDEDRVNEFTDILKSPHCTFSTSLKRLLIDGRYMTTLDRLAKPLGWIHKLTPFLKPLSGIEELALCYLRWSAIMKLPAAGDLIQPFAKSIQRLELISIEFSSMEDIYNILQGLTAINSIRLGATFGPEVPSSRLPTQLHHRLPSSLRVLVISGHAMIAIKQIIAGIEIPPIHTLAIRFQYKTDASLVYTLLKLVSASLLHLRLCCWNFAGLSGM